MSNRPKHWFRSIHDTEELIEQPEAIEYLKMWTGETFIHIGGTAYWLYGGFGDKPGLNIEYLNLTGVTHWRIPSKV